MLVGTHPRIPYGFECRLALFQTIEAGLRLGVIKPSELRRVNVEPPCKRSTSASQRIPGSTTGCARGSSSPPDRRVSRSGNHTRVFASACSPSRVSTPTLNYGDGRVDARANCCTILRIVILYIERKLPDPLE